MPSIDRAILKNKAEQPIVPHINTYYKDIKVKQHGICPRIDKLTYRTE